MPAPMEVPLLHKQQITTRLFPVNKSRTKTYRTWAVFSCWALHLCITYHTGTQDLCCTLEEKKEKSTECHPHWSIPELESAFDNRLQRDSHANRKTAAQLYCLLTFPDKSGITICTIRYVALNICFTHCTEPHCAL